MMLCYSINNGTAQVAGGGTKYCGSYTGVAQYCCANNDFCVGSSICYFTRPSEGYGNSSGYYIGSCTDESFSSPECSRECSDLAVQDIVYNAASSLWSCCWGSSGLDCSKPTNESFEAPSPEQLAASLYIAVPSDSLVSSSSKLFLASTTPSLASSMTPQASTMTSQASTMTSQASTTTSQASTMTSPASSSLESLKDFSSNTSPLITTVFPQPSSAPSTGLRTGAKAAITVTGIVVGLALLAAMFYLLIRQARLRKPNLSDSGVASGCTSKEASFCGELHTKRSVELDSRAIFELPACIDTIEVG